MTSEQGQDGRDQQEIALHGNTCKRHISDNGWTQAEEEVFDNQNNVICDLKHNVYYTKFININSRSRGLGCNVIIGYIAWYGLLMSSVIDWLVGSTSGTWSGLKPNSDIIVTIVVSLSASTSCGLFGIILDYLFSIRFLKNSLCFSNIQNFICFVMS